MNEKSLEQIILTQKRICCKCHKTMQKGETAMKYTHKRTGTVSFTQTMYWCDDCEKRQEQEAVAND